MWRIIIITAVFLTFTTIAWADKCYRFNNTTSSRVVLTFRYDSGVIPNNGLTRLEMIPNGSYDWCFQPNYTDNVTVDLTGARWRTVNGTFKMGNSQFSLPGGMYDIVSSQVAAPPSRPATPACINNSYANNDKFCLLSDNAGNTVNCGIMHGGSRHGGPYTTRHLRIRCNPSTLYAGRIMNIVCPPDGTRCNLNETEFCVGFSQASAGKHCDWPNVPAVFFEN